MRSRVAVLTAGRCLAGLCLAGLPGLPGQPSQSPPAAPGQAPPGAFVIRDVRVFDGERVLARQSVLVENGKIRRLGGPELSAPGAVVVAGRGRTLLPGLIDAHVHVASDVEDCLSQALAFGVTTVLDMFTNPQTLAKLKSVEERDPPELADVRTAGIGATAPGGHPTQMGGPPIPTLGAPGQAPAFVDARVAEGSDFIKIIHDDLAWALGPGRALPTLDSETMQAVVEAAHARGKLAVVHIGTERQARDALAAGADGLAHMFTGESAGSGFGELAAARHAFVIPTLSTLHASCGRSDGPALLADPRLQPYIRTRWQPGLTREWPLAKPSCTATADGMRQLVRAGVPILAGTDAPVPGTTYGASLHGELAALVEAGLTPLQALAAATSAPARAFRLADRGAIRPGMRADLVLVEGDPTHDILATRAIVAVWKRGVRAQR